MQEFVHLHNHSDYSMLDGAVQIPWYAQRAHELGMKHLGLTDHGNLFGALHFEKECRKLAINPVLGCEIYVAPDSRHNRSSKGSHKYHHLTLFCRNEQGYRNLLMLVSLGYSEGFYYKPRVDDEILALYHEGLICCSGCMGGRIPSLILEEKLKEATEQACFYRDLFGADSFFLEIMDHGLPEEKRVIGEIKKISKETGIPLIATNDVHYLHKSHANAQDILVCIGTNKKKKETTNRMKMRTEEFYFKTPQEMERLFSDLPEALTNTVVLAESCDLTIPQPGPIFPYYEIPPSFKNAQEYLEHLTWEGIRERYKTITEKISERVRYELQILAQMGFTAYFLIVWDFIHWAKIQKIPVGPGRGSGSGSLVAYALKITDIDPFVYGLIFERFLNPERISLPDFDIDFCYERRGEVIQYVTEKYGRDQVGTICTFGTLKTKAVLKDIARVLDLSFAESNEITKYVPEKTGDGQAVDLAMALEMEPKLRDYYQQGEVYKELFDTAKILEGMNRHVSTHACGIVIGRSKLTDYVPLYKDQKTSSLSSGYSMGVLEGCGLVKMDFLGLKTLTLLQNTAEIVRKREPAFNLDSISLKDAKTFKMLGRGESKAVFQFESQGMQKILRQAKPDNLEDLIALSALYRPGPMQYISRFINAKNGKEPVVYPDPSLKELLKPTYGVMVYQEQVMETARIIGGFSLAKGDILRRAMGKKDEKAMEELKVEFLEGAISKGYKRKLADEIFEMLKPFAGYGFNKSHAVAYSLIAYQTAYCKAHYPAEFMAANLTNEINQPDSLNDYLSCCREMGLSIRPPHINFSEKGFSVDQEGKIVYGLIGIKGLGSVAVDEILVERLEGPFLSFADFLERIPLVALNRKSVESLIVAGVFDEIDSYNRPTLLANLEELLTLAARRRQEVQQGQTFLFDGMGGKGSLSFPELERKEWSSKEKLAREKEILGLYISGHPLDAYRQQWKSSTTLNTALAFDAGQDERHTVLGIVKKVRLILTKRGEKMAQATLEDVNGSLGFVCFPRVYQEYGSLLIEEAILKVTGLLDLTRGEASLRVSCLEAVEQQGHLPLQKVPTEEPRLAPSAPPPSSVIVQEVHVQMIDKTLSRQEIVLFREFLRENAEGEAPLYLHLGKGDEEVVIKSSSETSVGTDTETLARIGQSDLVDSVWKE